MNDYFQIRLISKTNRKDLVLLLRDFVKEHEKYQEEDIDADITELDDDDSWIWLDDSKNNSIKYDEHGRIFYPLGFFCKENNMIGFCILCKLSMELNDWVILEFSIKSEFRNKGLGSKFAKSVIAFCVDKSHKNMSVRIEASNNVNNEGAHRFWNSLGFETIEKNVVFTDRTLYGVGIFHKNVYVYHFYKIEI